MEQPLIQKGLIADQEQAFRVRVQPADGINARRKTEFRQCPVGRAVAGELRQHAIGFVESDEHAGKALTRLGHGSKNKSK